MSPVLLAQVLCPSRHCIVAVAAGEISDAEMTARLKHAVAVGLRVGAMNPWCGLCGAPVDSWVYEVARTPFTSMEEAAPALKAEEAKQLETARQMRAAGLAYDKAPGADN
jgi:hypothetical protein